MKKEIKPLAEKMEERYDTELETDVFSIDVNFIKEATQNLKEELKEELGEFYGDVDDGAGEIINKLFEKHIGDLK